MSISNYGFIYLGAGTENPKTHRSVIDYGGLKTTIVSVPNGDAVVEAATELMENGAQLIELCGAFGPNYAAKVIKAVGHRVPVGFVSYSVESARSLEMLGDPKEK